MMKQGVVRQRGGNGTLPFIVLQRNQYSYPQEHDKNAIHKRFSHIPYNWILRARMAGWVGAALGIALVTLIQSANQTTVEGRFFPPFVQCISDDSRLIEVRRLELVKEIRPSKFSIYVSERDRKAQEHVNDSKDYDHHHAFAFESDNCWAQYSWQLTSFPTCNVIHEADLTNIHAQTRKNDQVGLIGSGYYRDVWFVREFSQEKRVLKTLRYKHEFHAQNNDRHRIDAVAMERLTKSPHVLDIYGYCGNSGLYEYAEGGNIYQAIWPSEKKQNLTQIQKLHIATQVAASISEVHNVDKEGQASMAHTDINPMQFVWHNGMYRLNDFNRAQFLAWSRKGDKPCGYYYGTNGGKNRSPEEYWYQTESEKVDVYSMGNIFYMLLTSKWPFQYAAEEDAIKAVKKGKRPVIPEELRNSNDPVNQALKEAMYMCHVQDQYARATARQVETLLKGRLLSLDPYAMKSWGL